MTFSASVLRNMIQQPFLEGIKRNEYANVGLLSHMIRERIHFRLYNAHAG